jgi:hypothetical protein
MIHHYCITFFQESILFANLKEDSLFPAFQADNWQLARSETFRKQTFCGTAGGEGPILDRFCEAGYLWQKIRQTRAHWIARIVEQRYQAKDNADKGRAAFLVERDSLWKEPG